MSLARAFTTRRGVKKSEISASPQRGPAPKHSFSVGNLRSKISAPVELISTTNMLSYNAPDIYPSNASASSDSESATTASTPPTSPDTSSIESSPTTVEPNHLSGYFSAAVDRQSTSLPKHSASVKHSSSVRHSASTSHSTATTSTSTSTHRSASTRQSTSSSISSDPSAPAVPQRALSHTKKSHEIVSRKLSISRMSSQKNSISTRSSLLMFSSNVDTIAEQQPLEQLKVQSPVRPQMQSNVHVQSWMQKNEPHPFGNELAKVSEIAEEFGVKDKMQVIDQEEQEMISRGLFKFCAEDYMKEIHGLFVSTFYDTKQPSIATMWI
ncbi:hypothetical protein B7463_g5750, partial [Scytalidium lignicola]